VAVSISGTVNVSAEGLQGLQQLPGQIESLVNGARQALEAIQRGEDGGNALGSLLAGFDALGQSSGELPALDSALAPLRDLAGGLPDRALADLTSIRGAVDEALAMFGPVKDLIMSGQLDRAMEEGVGRVLDVAASQLRPGDEVNEVLGNLEEFFTLFRSVLDWSHHPPTPAAAARVFAAILIGAPDDLLARPAEILESALSRLDDVLPDGADLRAWRGAAESQTLFWDGIDTRLSSGPVNWPQLEADLRAQVRVMLDLRSARDRLLADAISALASTRLEGVPAAALAAIPPVSDFRLSTILHGLRNQLEDILRQVEEWNPTPDDLRRLSRGLSGGLRTYLEQSPLGQLRNLMLDFEHRALVAIESLPFRDVARTAEDALRSVAMGIDALDVEALKAPVREFFDEVESQIQAAPPAAVRDAIAEVWDNIDNVFDEINTALGSLRTTLEGLVGNLETLIQQLEPAMASITASVDEIRTLLDEFDILEAADAVVEQLHKLRDEVAALDFSKLPDAAVSALHAGAGLLREIDVAGAVNPELEKALGEIDPTPMLEQAAASLTQALNQLRLFDPQAIVAQLDRPVDELLGVLREFGPDRLRLLVEEAIKPVEDAIKSIDAAQLLAPVTQLFQELLARVDGLLNPDIIFAPLNELFQPIVDVVDAVEPSRLIGLVLPHADSIGETVGSAAGPPSVMTSAGATLRQAIPEAAEAAEDLFGFRPGDLLLPLIDLYRKFREIFDRLDNSVLDPACRLLAQSFHARLEALQPASISLRVDASISVVLQEFQAGFVAERLDPAINAYHDAAARIGALARQSLSPADAPSATRIVGLLGDLNPLVLVPEPAHVQGIATASASVKASLSLAPLQDALPALNKLRTFLPPFLAQADAGAAALRQFVIDLDPSPVRLQMNEAFDSIGRRIVALQEPLMAGLDELMGVIEEFLLPVSPGHVIQLARRLHAALKDQILAVHPNTIKDEVQLIFDAVKLKLRAFDPSFLAGELNQLRDSLIAALRAFIDELLPDMAPFLELQERLAELKPSHILRPAVDALKPVTDTIALLDVNTLAQPLIDAIDRVRQDLPEVVSRVEGGLDEVLAAIPEGGASGASASAAF
jgi:hypothetical protein